MFNPREAGMPGAVPAPDDQEAPVTTMSLPDTAAVREAVPAEQAS